MDRDRVRDRDRDAVFTLGPVPYRILANRTRRIDFVSGLHSHY